MTQGCLKEKNNLVAREVWIKKYLKEVIATFLDGR